MEGKLIYDWSGELVRLDDLPLCEDEQKTCFGYCNGRCIVFEEQKEGCTHFAPLALCLELQDEWLVKARNKLYERGGIEEQLRQRRREALFNEEADWDMK